MTPNRLLLGALALVAARPLGAQPGRRPRPTSISLDDVFPRLATPISSTRPPGVPELPWRPDVAATFRAVGPAVRACGVGAGGTAVVTVVFASDGHPATVTVAPPFAGTPVGACAQRSASAARVPPFRRRSFSVTFPFALR